MQSEQPNNLYVFNVPFVMLNSSEETQTRPKLVRRLDQYKQELYYETDVS